MIASCIFIMAKYPTVGDVKTRLGKTMGYEDAARLYICFLKDTVEKVRQLGTTFFVHYTPKDMEEEFKQLLGEDLTYIPQNGPDLGARLYNGFKTSSQMGYQSAIALASDVPDLPVSILKETVKKLLVYDTVLGPSPDGGYYLIGLKDQALAIELFRGINWSSDTVYEETLDVIEKEGLTLHQLEPWEDVDQVSDLSRLINSESNEFQKTHTWRYLKGNETKGSF